MPLIALGSFVVPNSSAPFSIVVNDVNDGKTGAAVTAKVILLQSAFAIVNTLTAGAIPIGGYSDFRGIDTGSVRSLWANSDAYSPFGFKAADTGQSLGNHSIMDIWTDNFGQGEIYRTGKVSSIGAGTFTVLIDGNLRGGDTVFYTAIGGDDVDITFTNIITGTYSLPSSPAGLLFVPCPAPASSGGTAWGTGGQLVNWGFASRFDNAQATSALVVCNQGNNFSAQRDSIFALDISQITGALTLGPSVSAWTDTNYSISNVSGVGVGRPMVFSGANIVCTSGEFNTDDPGFDTGIDARAIFFCSTGYPTSSSVQSPIGQTTIGWAVPNGNQWGFWSGEKTNGNTGAAFGARYLSNTDILRATTNPNGLSTTFDVRVQVTGIDDTGPVTLDWPVSDHVSRQWLWFAIGLAPAPIVIDRGRGIYKLVPNKRQDTIWFDVAATTKYLAKKPDPNAYTSLLGDE